MLEAQKCKKYTGKFFSPTKKKKIYLIFDYWVDFAKYRTKNISSHSLVYSLFDDFIPKTQNHLLNINVIP